jgi:hypothetical protein
MRRILSSLFLLLLAAVPAYAEESGKDGDKVLSGMSIVGNDEAPKSLVIGPWKSSDLGDTLDVSRALDDGRQPVDRDVFMRALDYYQIREGAREGPGPGSQ